MSLHCSANTFVVALEKFNQLRSTYQNLQLAINEHGYESPKATVANELMLDVFKEFRLTPKQFDHLVNELRTAMDRVRTQERLIMRATVVRERERERESESEPRERGRERERERLLRVCEHWFMH